MALAMALLPLAAAAAELPLGLLAKSTDTLDFTDVTDVDAAYDAAGKLHVCGLRSNGDVRYWRYGTDGSIEQNLLVMEQCNAGCAIATKQYGSVERPVVVAWTSRAPQGSGFRIVETHDSSTTTTPSFTAPLNTYVETTSSESAAWSMTPPAIAREIGNPASANQPLWVMGATDGGVKYNKQNAGSAVWQGYTVAMFQVGEEIRTVSAIADSSSGVDRIWLAYARDAAPYVRFAVRSYREDTGVWEDLFSEHVTGQPGYPGTSISIAVLEGAPYLGSTKKVAAAGFYWDHPRVFRPTADDWEERKLAVTPSAGHLGAHVKLAVVDGTLAAAYVSDWSHTRTFATFDATLSGCGVSPPYDPVEPACWRRTTMLMDYTTTVLTRTALAVKSPTATAAAFIAPQSSQPGPGYPGLALGMTARVPKVTCGSVWMAPPAGYTYSAPKLVGEGSTWFAVYRESYFTMFGTASALRVRRWDPSNKDGTGWGSVATIVAGLVGGVADFDAEWDGTHLHATWIRPSDDTVHYQEMYATPAQVPGSYQQLDSGISDTGVVRMAVTATKQSVAYAKSGNIAYTENSGSGWVTPYAVLDDASSSYRVLSVGHAANRSSGARRLVGVLTNGTMKTNLCTAPVCDALADWALTPTTLGAPDATGGAWLDDRVGVAISPDGSRTGIVGGGTTTAHGGGQLYLHEDTGAGFGASATTLDSTYVSFAWNAGGRMADIRYSAAGRFTAYHFDATAGEVRTVRRWRVPSTSTSVDRWASPLGLTGELRAGADNGGDGFVLAGLRDDTGGGMRFFCEPTVY